jgi:hypothetical protein
MIPVIDAKAQNPCHVPELVSLDPDHLTLQGNIHFSYIQYEPTEQQANNFNTRHLLRQNAMIQAKQINVSCNTHCLLGNPTQTNIWCSKRISCI